MVCSTALYHFTCINCSHVDPYRLLGTNGYRRLLNQSLTSKLRFQTSLPERRSMAIGEAPIPAGLLQKCHQERLERHQHQQAIDFQVPPLVCQLAVCQSADHTVNDNWLGDHLPYPRATTRLLLQVALSPRQVLGLELPGADCPLLFASLCWVFCEHHATLVWTNIILLSQ